MRSAGIHGRKPTSLGLAAAAAAVGLCATGCGTGAQFSGALPAPDGQRFVNDVYPLLLRDCAFVACHGGPDRFFQVHGPGRARLDPQLTPPDGPVTLAEVQHSYDRARSMLATADELERTLLLSKPLDLAAGGQGHEGVDDLGRNVFATVRDPAYVVLSAWARSIGAPPSAADVDAARAAAELSKEAGP